MLPKKKMRSNKVQLQLLVDYMSTHRDFAHGEYSGPMGAEAYQRQWERLMSMLSEHGPTKSIEQWRVTWRDLKKKAREDGARVRQARATTGNLVPVPNISELNSKILGIIGKEMSTGLGAVDESGFIRDLPREASPQSLGVPTTNVAGNFYVTEYAIPPQPVTEEVIFSTYHPPSPLYHPSSTLQHPSSTLQHTTPTLQHLAPSSSSQTAQLQSLPTPLPLPLVTPIPPYNLPMRPEPTVPNPTEQRRTGISRADDFLMLEGETRTVLKDILNCLKEENLNAMFKKRQRYAKEMCHY